MVPRFYLDAPLRAGGVCTLPEDSAHHAVHVLRLREGDEVTLFNGRGGEFAARIASMQRLQDLDRPAAAPRGRARIAAARHAGSGRVVGRAHGQHRAQGGRARRGGGAARCSPRARWRGRKASAPTAGARTGRRSSSPPASSAAATACLRCSLWSGDRLAAAVRDENPAVPLIRAALLQAALQRKPIILAAGPEAGINEKEEARVVEAGFVPASLGPRVLRTETAAVAALAALNALRGDS